ncbi:MAG: hypothetical protein ACI4QT_01975 [Kiritimatiellia bacterium]
MPYQKKYATKAELSAALSAAAKNRKTNHGGRPKGSKNKGPSKRMLTRTMTIREPDYLVFNKCAHAAGVPMVEFMHMNAEGLIRRNPDIFGANSPTVEA